MDFYTMERFEIIGDMIEEFLEDLAFEMDMDSDPYETEAPTDEDLYEMEMFFLGLIE